MLIDKYFEGREVEVDAVCDGQDVLIPGIMEHVERAGVHSGDSMAIYPGLTLSEDEVNTIVDYTTRIGRALGVRGLMNIQYVVVGGPAYRSRPGQPAERRPARTYRRLRHRGQPALKPHHPLHIQGDRRAHGAACGQDDAGARPCAIWATAWACGNASDW